MKGRFHRDRPLFESGDRHTLGDFVRSLLAGIPWSERAQGDQKFNLKAPAGRTVRVDNTNGRTRLFGEERDDIEVSVSKCSRAESPEAAKKLLEAIHVESSEAEGELVLDVVIPRRWNRRGHANLDLRVPRGTSVQINATNGSIALENLHGSVRARSSNGSISVQNVTGDVDVQTSNGKICCACTCGRLFARSSNRKIELKQHKGSLNAMTSNGLIQASLEALGEEGVLLCTSNGRIALELPEDTNAELDMRVDNGVIRNARELDHVQRESSGRIHGTLGRGGSMVKLRTSNGSISIR